MRRVNHNFAHHERGTEHGIYPTGSEDMAVSASKRQFTIITIVYIQYYM